MSEKGMMIAVVVAVVGCACMCSSIVGGAVLAKNPDFLGTLFTSPSSVTAEESKLYGGKGGANEYSLACPPGEYFTKLNIDSKMVGSKHRVNALRAQCNKTTDVKQAGVGDKNDEAWVVAECPTGISGFNVWNNGKIIQRLQPRCQDGSTAEGVGSPIGTRESFECPSGKRIAKMSGWVGADLDSIRFNCR